MVSVGEQEVPGQPRDLGCALLEHEGCTEVRVRA